MQFEADFAVVALRLVKRLEFRLKRNSFSSVGFLICSVRDESGSQTPRARAGPRLGGLGGKDRTLHPRSHGIVVMRGRWKSEVSRCPVAWPFEECASFSLC